MALRAVFVMESYPSSGYPACDQGQSGVHANSASTGDFSGGLVGPMLERVLPSQRDGDRARIGCAK